MLATFRFWGLFFRDSQEIHNARLDLDAALLIEALLEYIHIGSLESVTVLVAADHAITKTLAPSKGACPYSGDCS